MTIYETERFGSIAHEVVAEAVRSIDKHGEQTHLPMGTGPDTAPLEARAVEPGSLHESGLWPGMRARQLARIATLDTKSHSANEGGDDTCTWWLILREEVFEAASEDDPAKLRAELMQVAAVALKMIDALDREPTAQSPEGVVPDLSAFPEVQHRIEGGRFVCPGDENARCHHCPGCDGEHDYWPCGCEYVAHAECWIKPWIDASSLADSHAEGPDDYAHLVLDDDFPDGDVETTWEGEYVLWNYVPRPPLPSPTDHTDGDQNA